MNLNSPPTVSSQPKIQHPDHSLKWKLEHTTKASKKTEVSKKSVGTINVRDEKDGKLGVGRARDIGAESTKLFNMASSSIWVQGWWVWATLRTRHSYSLFFSLSMISKHKTEHNFLSLWNLGFYRMFDKKEPSSSHVTTNFVINYAALE